MTVTARRLVHARRSEDGDTLVEILIALLVLGIAGVAIILAFWTSIFSSEEYRSLTTADTVLRSVAQETTQALQSNSTTAFACTTAESSGTDTAGVVGTYNLNGAISVPTGWTVTFTATEYWPSGASTVTPDCAAGAPVFLTATVNSAGQTPASLGFIVDDPAAVVSAGATSGPTHLAFLAVPANGTAGVPLFPAPEIAVENVTNQPVTTDLSPVSVALASGPTGATLTDCSGTEYSGVITFNDCQIDQAGTGYSLYASDTEDQVGTTTPLTPATSSPAFSISAGSAAQLAFTTSPASSYGGSAFPTQPQVTVEDAYSNAVAASGSSVTLAVATGPSTGVLTCTGDPSDTATTNASGVAVFSGCSLTTQGTYTLTASDGTLAPPTLVPSVTVNVGPAAQLGFTNEPGPATSGYAFPTPSQPAVAVEDAGGNVVTTVAATPVTLAISSGPTSPGTLSSCAYNPTSTSSGVATFTGCEITGTQGTYALAASAGSYTAQSTTFTVAGAAAQLKFTPSPGASTSGSAFGIQPVVSVEDSIGDLVTSGPSSTASITLGVASGPAPVGTLVCTHNSVSAVGGMATFASCKITGTQGTYSLSAAGASLTGTSNSFTVAGTPSILGFVIQPASSTGGIAFPTQPQVAVEDSSGDVVTTSTATVTLAVSANPPAAGTLSGCTGSALNGVTFFSGCAINTAGQGYTLTATSGTLTSATSTPFNITVGPSALLTFTPSPSSSIAGATFTTQPVVFVEDAGGNVVTTDTSQVTLSITNDSDGATLSCAVDPVTVNGGSAAFSGCEINFTGTYTLTASDGSLLPMPSQSFTISAGPPARLAFETSPGNTAAGTVFAQPPTVEVEDALGNLETTDTSQVTLSISANPGGGTLTCTSNPISASGGVATFAGCKISSAGQGYTLQAADGTLIPVISPAFNVVGTLTGLTPASGPVGTPASIAVTGFASNSTLTVLVDGTSAAITSGGTTNASGASSTVDFTIPAVPAGSQTVVVEDASGNAAASATNFTVIPSATGLTPTSGRVGTPATINAYGFAASSNLTLTVDGTVATIVSGGTSNANGAAAVQFDVPTVPAGAQTIVVSDASGDSASSATKFTVTPSIISESPSSGPVATSLTLGLNGFAGSSTLTATVDGAAATVTSGSPTGTNGSSTFIITVPKVPDGAQTVTVTDGSGDKASTTFTVSASITLSPSSASVGTSVTATAAGFAPSSALTVTVGTTRVTPTSGATTGTTGSSSVVFAVPSLPAGPVTVTITDGAGNTASATLTVNPSLSGLSPSTGPVGMAATISAQGFAPTSTLTVTVGGVAATVTSGGTTSAAGTATIGFTVPTVPYGAEAVVVTDGSGNTATSATNFLVATALSGITPPSGPVGTAVTVNATGFAATSTLTVKVGTTTVTVTSGGTTSAEGASTVGFTFPAAAHGAQTITVTDGAGHSATTTFTVTQSVSGMTPSSGPVGTPVTITAQGFAANSALTVHVGTTVATITAGATTGSGGSSTVTFTVPALAKGSYPVTVTDASANVATSASNFTVASAISFNPTSGIVGSTATVTGSGFTPSATVATANLAFGSSGSPTITTQTVAANGSWSATFAVPASSNGAQTVTATSSAGDSATGTFTVSASVSGLYPTTGPVGTAATLTANGFAANSSLTVTVGTSTATITNGGTTNANGSATVSFTVPAAPHGPQAVRVTDGSANTATSGTNFTITASAGAPSPAAGAVGSTASIPVTGFDATSTLTVKVGAATATVTGGGTTSAVGSATVSFTVPALAKGSYAITVTDASGVSAGSSSNFTVGQALTLNPTSGTVGTSVTISGSGYTSGATVSSANVTFGGATVTFTTQTVSAAGAWFVSVPVPKIVHGSATVTAGDSASDTASAPFTVNAGLTSLSPTSATPGTSVAVTAQGFAASSSLSVTVGSGAAATGAAITGGGTTAANGSSALTFTLPAVPHGAQTVTVTDGSGNSATTTITVNAALVNLTQTSGPVGTSVSVTGEGFAASSTMSVTVDGVGVTDDGATTNTSGTSTVTFTIPAVPHGSQTVTVTDGAANSASTPFSVTSSVTGLTPTTGAVGSSATVIAQGYAANSALTVHVGTTVATITTGATTGSGGSSSVTFTVPALAKGNYTVTVTDAATNTAATTNTFAVVPALSLNPSSGGPGSPLTLTGTGYSSGASVATSNVSFGTAGNLTITTQTVGTNGSWTASATVPTVPHGTDTVTATSSTTGDTASATYTVSPVVGTPSPSSATPGTTVTVAVSGFAAGSTLTVSVDGTGATVTSGGTTAANGTGTVGFTLPAAPAGAQTITVKDASANTGTAPITIVPGVSNLSPTTGPVGTSASILAEGYPAGGTLTVTVGGVSASITSGATASAFGASTIVFTVPAVPHGPQAVVVSDTATYQATSATPFTVTTSLSGQSVPTGPVGTSVTVTAQGFAASTALTVQLGTTPATVTSGGTTSAGGATTLTFTVPAVTHGAQTITVSDGTNTATSTFTVASSVTSLSPTFGPTGTSVTAVAQGYAATSALTVTVGGVSATVTGGGTTTANGTSTVTFTVPATAPVGSDAVVVTDGAGNTATSAVNFQVRGKVQSASFSCTTPSCSSGSNTFTLPASTQMGDLIVVSVELTTASGPTTVGVTDPAGNNYTLTPESSGTDIYQVGGYSLDSAPTASVTVTTESKNNGSNQTPSKLAITVTEFAGYTALDQSSSNAPSTASTSFTSNATPTETFANDLVVGTVGWDNPSATDTLTGTWTSTEKSVSPDNEVLAYQTVTTPGTASFAGTFNSSSRYGAEVFSFAPPTLTLSAPAVTNNKATFSGTSTTQTQITIYYCAGTVTVCNASNTTTDVTYTPTGNTWTSGATPTLTHLAAYTAQAYATDPEGDSLASGTQGFTG